MSTEELLCGGATALAIGALGGGFGDGGVVGEVVFPELVDVTVEFEFSFGGAVSGAIGFSGVPVFSVVATFSGAIDSWFGFDRSVGLFAFGGLSFGVGSAASSLRVR